MTFLPLTNRIGKKNLPVTAAALCYVIFFYLNVLKLTAKTHEVNALHNLNDFLSDNSRDTVVLFYTYNTLCDACPDALEVFQDVSHAFESKDIRFVSFNVDGNDKVWELITGTPMILVFRRNQNIEELEGKLYKGAFEVTELYNFVASNVSTRATAGFVHRSYTTFKKANESLFRPAVVSITDENWYLYKPWAKPGASIQALFLQLHTALCPMCEHFALIWEQLAQWVQEQNFAGNVVIAQGNLTKSVQLRTLVHADQYPVYNVFLPARNAVGNVSNVRDHFLNPIDTDFSSSITKWEELYRTIPYEGDIELLSLQQFVSFTSGVRLESRGVDYYKDLDSTTPLLYSAEEVHSAWRNNEESTIIFILTASWAIPTHQALQPHLTYVHERLSQNNTTVWYTVDVNLFVEAFPNIIAALKHERFPVIILDRSPNRLQTMDSLEIRNKRKLLTIGQNNVDALSILHAWSELDEQGSRPLRLEELVEHNLHLVDDGNLQYITQLIEFQNTQVILVPEAILSPDTIRARAFFEELRDILSERNTHVFFVSGWQRSRHLRERFEFEEENNLDPSIILAYSGGFVHFRDKNLTKRGLISFITSPHTLHKINTVSSESTWDMLLNHDSFLLVLFHTSWSSACEKIRPVWEALYHHFLDDSEVWITRVEAERHPQIRNRYALHSYPTILLFQPDRKQRIEYHGDRTLESLISFVNEQLTRDVAEMYTGSSSTYTLHADSHMLERELSSSIGVSAKQNILVLFVTDECSTCRVADAWWERIAQILQVEVHPPHEETLLIRVNASRSRKAALLHNVRTFPHIMRWYVTSDGEAPRIAVEHYAGLYSLRGICNYVSEVTGVYPIDPHQRTHPPSIHDRSITTESEIIDLLHHHAPRVLALLYVGLDAQEIRKDFEEVSRQLEENPNNAEEHKVIFVEWNVTNLPHIIARYGNAEMFPRMCLYLKHGDVLVYNGAMSVSEISSYLFLGLQKQKVEISRTYMTASNRPEISTAREVQRQKPSSQAGYHASRVESAVLKLTQDIWGYHIPGKPPKNACVIFITPQCEKCEKAMILIENVAQELKSVTKIKHILSFWVVNGRYEVELAYRFRVLTYPTILFFGTDGVPSALYGGRLGAKSIRDFVVKKLAERKDSPFDQKMSSSRAARERRLRQLKEGSIRQGHVVNLTPFTFQNFMSHRHYDGLLIAIPDHENTPDYMIEIAGQFQAHRTFKIARYDPALHFPEEWIRNRLATSTKDAQYPVYLFLGTDVYQCFTPHTKRSEEKLIDFLLEHGVSLEDEECEKHIHHIDPTELTYETFSSALYTAQSEQRNFVIITRDGSLSDELMQVLSLQLNNIMENFVNDSVQYVLPASHNTDLMNAHQIKIHPSILIYQNGGGKRSAPTVHEGIFTVDYWASILKPDSHSSGRMFDALQSLDKIWSKKATTFLAFVRGSHGSDTSEGREWTHLMTRVTDCIEYAPDILSFVTDMQHVSKMEVKYGLSIPYHKLEDISHGALLMIDRVTNQVHVYEEWRVLPSVLNWLGIPMAMDGVDTIFDIDHFTDYVKKQNTSSVLLFVPENYTKGPTDLYHWFVSFGAIFERQVSFVLVQLPLHVLTESKPSIWDEIHVKVPGSFPSLLVLKPYQHATENAPPELYKDEFNMQNIYQWLARMFPLRPEDRLPIPYFAGKVVKLDSAQFEEVVNNKKMDVFVAFYVTDCTACSEALDVFKRLALSMRGTSVVIAKLNLYENGSFTKKLQLEDPRTSGKAILMFFSRGQYKYIYNGTLHVVPMYKWIFHVQEEIEAHAESKRKKEEEKVKEIARKNEEYEKILRNIRRHDNVNPFDF